MAENRPIHDHERSDTRLRPLIYFSAALLAMTVLAMVAMWALFEYFQQQKAVSERPPSPLADQVERGVAPQIQTDPSRDLQRLRRREEAVLNTYGWVDPVENIVRIPVDRAIDIVAEKGLPYRGGKPGVEAQEP